MSRADLHVHSKFSDHPSEWFLQRIGTSESYTEPDYIYETAKKRGMNFVTISDHNSIEGAVQLTQKYPEDTFISVESTVYFPEDGCKIHILLFGISPEQFEIIQEIRTDIYAFRDYIKEQDIAYSVAHATYSVNGAVGPEQLEKLILLFDVFETINGGRNIRNNRDWQEFLENLTKEDIEIMQRRHDIEPMSSTPWVKGFTAGSDDHAGIFIGKTYTSSEAANVDEFLTNVKKKKTDTGGRHHDFHSMAFAIYKIAFDFIKSKQDSTIPIPVSIILDGLFTEKDLGFKKNYTLKKLKKKAKKNSVHKILIDLVEDARSINFHEMDMRLDILYKQVAALTDRVLLSFIESASNNIKKGNIDKLIRNFSSILPTVFLTIPFVSTFTHMFNNRNLVSSMYPRLKKEKPAREKKILWFTDTLTEMNGVALTVKEVAWISHSMHKNIKIAAGFGSEEEKSGLPPNIMEIPVLESFPMPGYEALQLRVPSFLKSLKLINDFDPDEIYISTPLPIGLLGLAASKLLNIPSVSIYHTDGTQQAEKIINDITMTKYIEGYLKWFYSNCTKTLVNTNEYVSILKTRGYRQDGIGLFKRGIDTDLFKPVENAKAGIQETYSIKDGTYTLFAGRVSRDKGVDIAIKAFVEASEKSGTDNHYMLIAGHGPLEEELKTLYRNHTNIVFLGRVSHEALPLLYSGSDIFIFPSTTDTFGRVVAEAMSCGLPVLVSATGGPQEIVLNSDAGVIIENQTQESWTARLAHMYTSLSADPEGYAAIRRNAREHILKNYNMQGFINELFENKANPQSKTEKLRAARMEVTEKITA